MKAFVVLNLTLIFAFAAFGESPEATTDAPDGQYSIVQRNVSTDDGVVSISTVLHFRDKAKPDVDLTLTGGQYADFVYRSSARYFISPDGRWILRIQHLGGGTNEAFLYAVSRDGQIRRREVSNAVFERIGHMLHRAINGRTQIELASWDIPSGSVHLDASYEPHKNDVQQPWLSFAVTYNLKNDALVIKKEVEEN